MKRTKSVSEFTVRFVAGVVLGVGGLSLAIMLLVKMPFLERFASSVWEPFWVFLFMGVGLFGFLLAEGAGWNEDSESKGGDDGMTDKLTEEQRKIVDEWLDEARLQKKSIEQWLTAEGERLKLLEETLGQTIAPIRAAMDL